jgi:cell division protein FtsL
MASLTDLFNPTFLMFLGILVLVVALLVVYFESKFREQNHKISSMLSLVSSLAEELNGTKMVIQHLSMRGGVQPQNFQQEQTFSNFNDLEENVAQQNTNNTNNIKLIQVSDDENSDSESETSDNNSESDDSIEILDDEI